jgi:hypothetical protein
MAQRVQVLLLCDLHEGETAADETVTFAVDGTSYEVDVCKKHAGQLRDAFAPYVGAGRRVASGNRGRTGRRRGPAGRRAGDIREWARSQGIAVSERGRISADIQARYDAAHR